MKDTNLTWNEIVTKYPGLWVGLDNEVMDGPNVIKADVVCACPDDEMIDKRLEYISAGHDYLFFENNRRDCLV